MRRGGGPGIHLFRLPELQEKAVTVGYRVERLACVVEKDLEKHG